MANDHSESSTSVPDPVWGPQVTGLLPADKYTVIYVLKDKTILPPVTLDQKPEIERLEIDDDIALFSIKALQPPDIEISENQKEALAVYWPDKQFFHATHYYPNAVPMTYRKARMELTDAQLKDLRAKAVETISYEFNCFNKDKRRRPEDLNYLYVEKLNHIHVFAENCVLLEPVDPKITAETGIRWKKIKAGDVNRGNVP